MTAPDDAALLATRAPLAEPPPAGPVQRWINRYAALGERGARREDRGVVGPGHDGSLSTPAGPLLV